MNWVRLFWPKPIIPLTEAGVMPNVGAEAVIV
jgi:hypothetical protein